MSFVERLGYFAEAVNVNGAIALEKIRRTGVTIDEARRDVIHQNVAKAAMGAAIQAERLAPGLFKRHKRTGELLLTKNGARV